MSTFTLREIATGLGAAFGVEQLGGNVYAVTDFSVTVTINGGQLAADTTEEAADILVCDSWTGVELFRGEIRTAAEVAPILASVGR